MEKTKKKIVLTVIFSIIISVVFELIMKYGFENDGNLLVDKIIIDSMILFYLGLHFVVGFSKLYDFIIKHRYKISGILLLIFTLLQYSGAPSDLLKTNTIKFMQAFWWNFRFFALILVSFEFCKLLTKENEKISLAGSIIITFSGACQWMFGEYLIEVLTLGELLIILLNKFLLETKFKKKILYSLAMSICIIMYAFTAHFSWMISFGYLFVAIAIWVFIKNRKEYKVNKKDVILFIINLALIIANEIIFYVVIGNGNIGLAKESKGGGMPYLFSYLYNFLLPYKNIGDEVLLSSVISICPVPMIMAIYYLYTKEKHISFLIPVSIVAVIEAVVCMSGLPDVIERFTLFSNVTAVNAAVVVGFANLYLLLYMITNIEEEIVSFKVSMRLSILFMCIMVFMPLPSLISSKGYVTLFSAILCMFTFLFLNNKDKKYRKVLMTFLVLFTLAGGIFVNPVVKGGKVVRQIGIDRFNAEIIEENK